jgi:hypothetical protein
MSGLFDLYLSQKKYELAYDTARVMFQKNPPGANRLLDLVKLSVSCSKYEDLMSYCHHFKALNTTEPTLNRAVIAGLLIASRYFRTKNQAALAAEALKDASRISIRAGLLYPEVFRYLIENEDFKQADEFYAQIPEAIRQRPAVAQLRMELLFHFNDYAQLMNIGQNLVKEKADTPRVYELMIASSRKLNRSEQVIENLILESKSRHPSS